MKNDEIEKLEAGRELDALVAEKVMGLSDVHEHVYPSGEKQWTYGVFRSLPRYSTDIAAAWVVMEAMAEKYSVDFYNTERGWRCDIDDFSVTFSGKTETAPLAICRAALMAMAE